MSADSSPGYQELQQEEQVWDALANE